MSNISSNSARITVPGTDFYPFTLEGWNERNSLVDMQTIPNYAGKEHIRMAFGTADMMTKDRTARGLVAIPFGIDNITADQLNDWATFVALRGLPCVAAICLPNMECGFDDENQRILAFNDFYKTYVYSWIGQRHHRHPTASVWEAISQTIGIREGGPALRELLMNIWKKAAIAAKEKLGDQFYAFPLLDGKTPKSALEWEGVGRTSYEASVLFHATKLLPDGDPILAQAILAWLRFYYNFDCILITPEGMAATTNVVTLNCGAIQWSPRERMWTAHTRAGPVTTLRRAQDFEGNHADYTLQFERFLRFHQWTVFGKGPATNHVDWHSVDSIARSHPRDMKNKVSLSHIGLHNSPYLSDILIALPSVATLVTQQVTFTDKGDDGIFNSNLLLLMQREIDVRAQYAIVPLVGKCRNI
jgi:hypothetical protein